MNCNPRPASLLTIGALLIAGCQSLGAPTTPRGLSHDTHRGIGDQSRQKADLQFALGRSLEHSGDIEQAIAAYSSAVMHDPERADALVRLAILHDHAGRFDESAKLYQQALQVSPGNADIFADYGYSRYLQGELADAETHLKQALALQPEHRRAGNNLGMVLTRQGRTDAALAAFRRAGTSIADAHANSALALVMDQKLDEAVAQYERALAVDPRCQSAREGLSGVRRLLAETGDHSGPRRADLAAAVVAPPVNTNELIEASGDLHTAAKPVVAVPAGVAGPVSRHPNGWDEPEAGAAAQRSPSTHRDGSPARSVPALSADGRLTMLSSFESEIARINRAAARP